MKKYSILSGLLISLLMVPTKKNITIWLIGDSTMSKKEVRAYPETGWGMPFSNFWDSTVTIENRAVNGRSTKSFLAENRWQPVVDKLQEGDYVFIQFGHNDESKDKGERYTTPEEFRQNLLKYVTEAKARKAIPVLFTPVARKKFDENGKVKESHGVYPQMVKEVAAENNVLLIDLNEKSKLLYEQYGPETAKLLFNYLEPGEHPNYPDGKQDDTHFSELGARKIAELILKEIRTNIPELAARIKH
jgi:lysophospholipase L1-like esterase